MQPEKRRTLQLFCAYVEKDRRHYETFRKHMKTFVDGTGIGLVGPEQILAGEDIEETIRRRLKASRVVVFLLSPDFIGSDEGARYMRLVLGSQGIDKSDEDSDDALRNQGNYVIPVKIRPVDLVDTSFFHMKQLPHGADSIVTFGNRDRAWKETASEIKKIITNPQASQETGPLKSVSRHAARNADRRDGSLSYFSRGQEHYALGEYGSALEMFGKSLEMRKALLSEIPYDIDFLLDMCASRYWVGHLKFISGDYAAAANEFDSGLSLSEKAAMTASDDDRVQRTNVVLNRELGTTWMELGDLDKSENLLRQSLSLAVQIHDRSPNAYQSMRDLYVSRIRLAELLVRSNMTNEALEHFKAVAEQVKSLSRLDPDNSRTKQIAAMAFIGCGDACIKNGTFPEGVAAYTKAEDILNELVLREGNNVQWLYFSSIPNRKKGLFWSACNRPSEALAELAKSAASLANANSLAKCLLWQIELMENYAIVWDICRNGVLEHPFTSNYVARRAQALHEKLLGGPPIPYDMTKKLRSLESKYPQLFLCASA